MMRKIIFICLFLQAISVGAQTRNTREILVGEVTVMDKLCKVYADISPDSSQIYQFSIEPCFVRLDTWGEYRFVIPVTPSMIEEFNLISQKYKEWSKVAIDNKAVVKKDMEIETPIRKSREKVSNKVETFDISIKPYFAYTLKKDPTLAFTESAHDKYHPNYYSLIFSNPEQLDNFISFLDPKIVLDKIKKGQIGSLFK